MRSGLSLASFSLFAAGILLASASESKVITYTFTPLSSLGGNSYASAINNSGKIVGYSYLPNSSVFHAVRWNGSSATDIGTLNGKNSEARGINDSGQIVGQSWDAEDMPRPVLWNGSQVTDLGTLGGRVGFAGDINSSGEIAGQSDISLGQRLATRWDAAGVITNLGTLDGNFSYASAINRNGQIVGTSYATPFTSGAGNPTHATLWNGTFATDLDPNGSYSSAYDINDHGQIVGSVQQPEVPGQSRETHATLWNGITPVDLGTLGGSFSDPELSILPGKWWGIATLSLKLIVNTPFFGMELQ
jgi:probable HAF family extracellular repeat protein